MPILGLQVVVALLTLATPSQRSPSPEEQKAFADGLLLFNAGDARGAERAWKAGYALDHDRAFLIRIGEAEEKAGAPTEAARSYAQYLRESPDAADRPDVEARVQRLAPPSQAKPPVDVETPAEMRGPTTEGKASVPHLPTLPGAAAAPEPSRGPDTVIARPVIQARDDSQQDLAPLVDDEGARSPMNVAGWVGTGVTTLLLGVATFYGASAADKAGDANRLLIFRDPDTGMPQEYAVHASQFEEDVRAGRRDDRLAKGFLIAAGITATVSAILFILDRSPPRRDGEQRAGNGFGPLRRAAGATLRSPGTLGLSSSFQ